MDTASSVYPELSTTPTPTQHDHFPRDQPYDRFLPSSSVSLRCCVYYMCVCLSVCAYVFSEVGEMVQGWSDATLMEAVQSGRYSAWSTEEGVSQHYTHCSHTTHYCRTSLIRTPMGQKKAFLIRCVLFKCVQECYIL